MDETQVRVKRKAKEDIWGKRCKCNKLLCVVNANDIEIKCNKCKRLMIIKTAGVLDIEISEE